jgi:aerotaxis receptor
VAGEVKALAAQTANATKEIAQQISSLRGATGAAVTAVDEIGRTLDEVAQVAVSVAAAIEEQNAATKEIARNITESGSAVREVITRIAEVSAEARTTGDQAAKLRATSDQVAGDIAVLRGALVRTVRTATVEADRRSEGLGMLDEPCMVTFGSDVRRIAGTLSDVAHGGAAITLSDGGEAAGEHGTVVLERRGGVRARFEVRSTDPDGRLHVKFVAPESAFEQVLETLLAVPREARRA